MIQDMSKVGEYDKPMDPHERWSQCPNNGYDILLDNGDFICAFVHDDTHSPMSRARCARAVTCVSALQGIDDPAEALRAMRAEIDYHRAKLRHHPDEPRWKGRDVADKLAAETDAALSLITPKESSPNG